MEGVTGIATSALNAYGVRQAVSANNVANTNTPDFKASTVISQEKSKGGVTATVLKSNDSVDISKEAVNSLSNKNGYKANLKTLKAADEMTKELLSVKA